MIIKTYVNADNNSMHNNYNAARTRHEKAVLDSCKTALSFTENTKYHHVSALNIIVSLHADQFVLSKPIL